MNATRLFFAAAFFTLTACSRPEPPTIRPVSGRVTSLSTTGITLEVKLEAQNPNVFNLQVRSFTATIVLDHRYTVGTLTAPHAITLPANQKNLFDVSIPLKWNNVATLAPLALSNRDIPYEARGAVTLGNRSFEVELPFEVTGVVTHQQLVQAVEKSLPKLPGLPL